MKKHLARFMLELLYTVGPVFVFKVHVYMRLLHKYQELFPESSLVSKSKLS